MLWRMMPAFVFVLKPFEKRRKIFRSQCALEVVPTSSAWVDRLFAPSKVALDPTYPSTFIGARKWLPPLPIPSSI